MPRQNMLLRVSEASAALSGYLTGRSVTSDPHQLSAYLNFFSAPRWGCLSELPEGTVSDEQQLHNIGHQM